MRALIGLLLLTGVAACSKGVDPPADGPAPNHCGVVSGIQPRDVSGAPIEVGDTTDWRTADAWCDAVEALFADRPAVVFDTAPPDSLLITCFPNPTTNQFLLGFYRSDSSYIDIRFVDTQFQLLWAADSLTATQLLFRADSMGIAAPQMIRAYYRVVHANGSAHRGHGDVEIL